MLNRPGPVTDDIGTSPSGFAPPSGGPYYADLRGRNDAISEMLYGDGGTLSQPSPPQH